VGGNLLAVWQNVTARAAAERLYNIHIEFRDRHDRAAIADTLRKVDGVRRVETVDTLTAYLDRGDQLPVASAGRNLMPLRFAPASTQLMSLSLVQGRWLKPQDERAIVLNTAAAKTLFPNVRIGDRVALLVNRRPVNLEVVGIAVESFSRAAGYTTPDVHDAVVERRGTSVSARVAIGAGHATRVVRDALMDTLGKAGMPVRFTITDEDMKRGEDAHVYVLVGLLGLIIVGVGTVGAVGLASALGTSVIERTREFGVMRALGARSGHIYKGVVSEAVLIGIMSWVFALLLSIPLTLVVMVFLKTVAQVPLSLEWSQLAAFAWLAISMAVAALASIYPARRASRLRVGEAVAQV